jgi:wyosine [tRNA(Phe)-imidazoG37] synthetase (radical SAM superfamily)
VSIAKYPTEREQAVEIPRMIDELREVMTLVSTGSLKKRPYYEHLPSELLKLKHVSLSGDGELTLSPNFMEIIKSVVHFRALRLFPFFKLVLVTNGTRLNQASVFQGIQLLKNHEDEVWTKLDVGDQARFEAINGANESLESSITGIANIAKRRPVIIQSLQTSVHGKGPQS